jgi:tetratricopeptide (TPR) repeat protein
MMFSIKNYKNTLLIAAFLAISLTTQSISYAQTQDSAQTKQEFEQTFEAMLQDPSNIDVTMRYANLAIKLEDYEAAIPALERILLFNPDLPKVKQQLGVLYYKLDSFEMAKSYLEDAVKSDNAPDEVVETANKYLQRIQ